MYIKLMLVLLLVFLPSATMACTTDVWTREKLLKLKADGFIVIEKEDQQAVIDQLFICLSSPDPDLRDGIAYEGLSKMLRNNSLNTEQQRNLRSRLYLQLVAVDTDGVSRPFAALMLSEVARTDRMEAWMSEQERAEMLAIAINYMETVRDYRGFDPDFGWRHGIAHGADWLMQLALNPKLNNVQLRQLTDAVASQVVTSNGHAYVFGEPGRLARPIIFAAKRGIRTEIEWQSWLNRILAGIGDSGLAYKNLNWLYARHNVSSFLDTLYLETDLTGDEALKPLNVAVVNTLKNMP